MRMATGDGEDRPAEEIARGRWLELPRDSEAPFYQSRVPDFRSRWTRVPAAPASEVPALLDAACDRFEQMVPKEHEPTTDQAAGAAADLFVDVLKVHPFVDGNMRVAVVALATALRRLRQRPVAIYPNDLEFAVGLSYALRSTEDASREPMRNLVAQRLDHR